MRHQSIRAFTFLILAIALSGCASSLDSRANTSADAVKHDATKQVATFDVLVSREQRYVVSGAIELTGFLLAYWLPGWSDREQRPERSLSFRFFPDPDSIKNLPELPLAGFEELRSGARALELFHSLDETHLAPRYFAPEAARTLYRSVFPPEHVPDAFWRFREGRLLAHGTLVADTLLSAVDCDNRHFYLNAVSFTPNQPNILTQLPAAFAETMACPALEPEQIVVISDDHAPITVYQQPNVGSSPWGRLASGTLVEKIRTHDEHWIEIALPVRADDGEAVSTPTSGFVARSLTQELD